MKLIRENQNGYNELSMHPTDAVRLIERLAEAIGRSQLYGGTAKGGINLYVDGKLSSLTLTINPTEIPVKE